jgi:hypothetical protein
MQPFYDDNEGDAEINESTASFEEHMDKAGDAFGVAFGLDDGEHTIAERISSLGEMFTEESEALQNHGNGFSESAEAFCEGDGTVLGELGEAGAAIGGELLEAASEAGTAVIGGVLGFAGEIIDGIGDGAEDLGQSWDKLMDGDVVGAATELGEGAKDIGGAVVDAIGVGAEGAVDMFVELGEGALSVGAEIGEGISEVGSAIGEGLSDAWDSLFGDDEEEQEADEDAYAG